jgi:heme-degrading monooxygenase HmoA
MPATIYTLGVWQVKPEHEAEFITAWKDLGVIFSQLPAPPTGKGTLIQSVTEPTLFYSFGPWQSLEDVQPMRQNPQAQAGINRLRTLCTEAIPGSFRLVAET